MTENKCLANELLMSHGPETAKNPHCEEGGDAKPQATLTATPDGEMACAENADGFFIVGPSQEAPEPPSLQALLNGLATPKGLGGRPPKLTPDLKSKVCKLLCLGVSRRQAAILLDIDQSTISHAAERDPEFRRALERAVEFSSLGPKLAIAAAGLHDWRAAAWLLTHQQKHPGSLSAEQRAELHEINLEQKRQQAEVVELQDFLTEHRIAAREQRAKAAQMKKKSPQK